MSKKGYRSGPDTKQGFSVSSLIKLPSRKQLNDLSWARRQRDQLRKKVKGKLPPPVMPYPGMFDVPKKEGEE